MTPGTEKSWLLRLAFDGTSFHGTQRQNNGQETIQGLVEQRLKEVVGHDVKVSCCSRLDAKVSALDYCMSFKLPKDIDIDHLFRFLNRSTPESVKFISVKEVSPAFDAHASPHMKVYRYGIDNGLEDPLLGRYLYRPWGKLDLALLGEALALFVGKHDFSSFAALDVKSDRSKSFVSTIADLKTVEKRSGKLIYVYIKGPSFFRYQVRFIIGAAVQVSLGKWTLESVRKRLDEPDLAAQKFKAPATGLLLYKTKYIKGGKKDA